MVMAQTFETNYERPVGDLMNDVAQRFGVRFKYNVDTVGRQLPYADFRVRPYSIEETLDNICKYFDWNWWKQSDKLYKIKPYEYPRRHVEEGQQMLNYLSTLYQNKEQWEARRDTLRREVRQRLGLDAFLDSCVLGKPILSKITRHDGYTTQNICIELTPGSASLRHHICFDRKGEACTHHLSRRTLAHALSKRRATTPRNTGTHGSRMCGFRSLWMGTVG